MFLKLYIPFFLYFLVTTQISRILCSNYSHLSENGIWIVKPCSTQIWNFFTLIYQELSLGRGMGGRFKKEETYVYLWLITLMFDRRQQNSVKQLSFNLKINKLKKKRTTKEKRVPSLIWPWDSEYFSPSRDNARITNNIWLIHFNLPSRGFLSASDCTILAS